MTARRIPEGAILISPTGTRWTVGKRVPVGSAWLTIRTENGAIRQVLPFEVEEWKIEGESADATAAGEVAS